MNEITQTKDLINKLNTKCKTLENDLDLKKKENESLQKNLNILQTNIRSKSNSFEKDINFFLHSSEIMQEQLIFDKQQLENEVEELEQEAKRLREQLGQM